MNCNDTIYWKMIFKHPSLKGYCWYASVSYHNSVGRALAISGAGVGLLGLATNNEGFQRVGGSALVGGIGLKGLAKVFGRR